MLPYIKTEWHDHIVDPIDDTVVQQGTRFTARRANNLEDMVEYLANVNVPYINNELLRFQLELEMLGRSPVNNGTFFAVLDGGDGKHMELQSQKAILQSARSAGATSLEVDATPFVVGQVITITDEEQSESVRITEISTKTLTVTATTKAFKKGAFITRSSAVLNTNQLSLQFGNWSTYKVEVV